MKVLCFILFIAMFKFVSLRTISESWIEPNLCPSFCSCDVIDNVVDCRYNNLTEVPVQLDKNVTLLNLSFNSFSGIPKEIINLPKLLYLDLSNNPYIKFIEMNFQSVSLKNLQLKSCSIDYIDNSLLKGLPNLEVLDLSRNPISFINNSLVSLSLKSLDISYCNLKHIKPEAFSGITSLLYLSLNDNPNLRQFLCGSENLLRLDISNCNIEHIPSGSLKKLVELDLHGNNVQRLRNRSFSNLASVEILNVSFNAIREIEANCFTSLDRLISIDLSYNRLTDINKNTFKKNNRLRSLYLSHNYLRRIKDIASNSLQLLDLTSCEITYLMQYSLSNLPVLTELHLSRNQITHIPNKFDSAHLVYLDIGYNDISSINNETFAAMRSLRFLVLSGNKLTTSDPSYFAQIIDLSIEDNPWLCDCASLQRMYNWMIRTDQNTKYLRCQLPAKFEGLTWEEACHSSWSKSAASAKIYVSKRIDKHRKNQNEQEMEERLAAERLEFIQRQHTRERLRRLEELEESRNAPDPRESQGPPTYNEALMLPRLDSSHLSLAGSLPSLSSVHTSNPDVSKRRRQRRRRRRKQSSSPPRGTASCSNLTEASENDRPLHTELEESSF
ncbi:hypothetical protein WA026_008710 [Henosepilachna vigintioctopunctata]|uniref:Uncharacterized protein n=1 Tax=Henosepilachna vigintioctopunctata TaxID=420089 RepID=A0AAW1V8J8_9CUCU